MGETLDAGGRASEGKGGELAEARCGGVGLGDVDEDAAADAVFVIGGGVLVNCYLIGGAGVDEV